MKATTIIFFQLILMALPALAQDCVFRPQVELKRVIVEPVYVSQVNFVFNEQDQSAFAMVNWKFDEAFTRGCIEQAQTLYPDLTGMVPTLTPDTVEISVVDGLTKSSLRVYPLANGQWFGDGDSIKVPYASREKIRRLIESGAPVISVAAGLPYFVDSVSRQVIGTISCGAESSEQTLDIFTRFSEILTLLNRRDQREGLDLEEIAESYVQTCVEFAAVEAEDFETLFKKLSVKSRLKQGEFSFKGNVYARKEYRLSTPLRQKPHLISL